MPFTPTWYVENRVLWMELSDTLMLEDVQAGNAAIVDMIRNTPNKFYLVRDGRGLRGLDVSPADIARIAIWMQPSKVAGMILLSGPDSLHLEVAGEVVARMKRIPAEGAFTLAEVHQRLVEFDPSLADLLPPLNT